MISFSCAHFQKSNSIRGIFLCPVWVYYRDVEEIMEERNVNFGYVCVNSWNEFLAYQLV